MPKRSVRAPLLRIDACKAGEIANNTNKLSDTEVACYESHRRAIQRCLTIPGHTMIVEDDVCFSPKTYDVINATIDRFSDVEWDLIYTDYIPLKFTDYVTLSRKYDHLQNANLLEFIDLKEHKFADATAYIVNAKSKAKLLQALPRTAEAQYDIALMKLANAQAITSYLIFPFVATINEFAEDTQIVQQEPEANFHIFFFNAMRRLLWIDAATSVDTAALLSAVRSRQLDLSPRGEVVSALFGLASNPHLTIPI